MFNSGEKKAAINRMNDRNSTLKEYATKTMSASEQLMKKRQILKNNMESLWGRINRLRNKPTELDLKLNQVKVMYDRYDELINQAQVNVKEANVAVGATGAGVATGIGMVALGPTTAMSIATTFGTASTGIAISELSGAAATNAALAWLGGGAAVAGGGGMAAGNTLLTLAGPVGWGLAAVSFTAGGILINSKNKKAIQQANEATEKLEAQIKIVEGTLQEISKLTNQTESAIQDVFSFIRSSLFYGDDYNALSEEEQYKVGSIVNDIWGFAKLLNKVIGEDGKVVDPELASENLNQSTATAYRPC